MALSPFRKLCPVESRSQCLKGVLLVLSVWISGMCFGYFYKGSTGLFDTTPFQKLLIGDFKPRSEFPDVVKSPEKLAGCKFPNLDPFDPAIKHTIINHPPLDCSKGVPNLVYLDGDTLIVNKSKIPKAIKNKNDSFKECRYKVHAKKPGSDLLIIVKSTSPPFTESMKINATDEHFFAECYNKSGHAISRSYFFVIRPKPKVEELLAANLKKHLTVNNPKETLNVLLMGIDGMSRQTFIRHMPQTRNFLLDVLNATEMHKYNKLGINTYPNVMGLLTGRHEKSFVSAKWNWKKSFFDPINDAFIWSDYRRAGYRTGLLLDRTTITAFHFQKKGWDKEPTDYYLRPLPVAYEKDTLMIYNGHNCVGDIPAITLYHDFWVQLASTFNNTPSKPYFGYSFAVRLTHNDHNEAGKGDHLFKKFLKELHDKNVLKNTVVIWFSDHGERFGKIRTTYNGILEARMPFLFLVFPQWFREKYPKLMEAVKINQERLTSHFDVYETLKDLLNFQAKTGKGDVKQRGISLFKEIPIERTCHHMEIPMEFCVCNNIAKVNVSTQLSQDLGLGLLKQVIASTGKLRSKCEELKLKSVNSVLSMASDSFIKSAKKGPGDLFQVTIITQPGDAIYEGTVHYGKGTRKVSVTGQVSRLNLYQGQAECIEDPILRPFCFCKK